MYDIHANGSADLLSINLSPEVGDGPRNSFPSDDGKLLYVVSLQIQAYLLGSGYPLLTITQLDD